MKLTCAGTKKSPTYYVQKSVRIGNKTTTKTVERLGAYSARTAHPFQRNGAPFRFKLSKAQQVD